MPEQVNDDERQVRAAHSYDERCNDLANAFLQDYPHREFDEAQLAQTIQDAVEAWLTQNGFN